MSEFNIRVYGLLRNEFNEILITDEFRFEHAFTKFPGGGLEFGEGLSDGLKREFKEELNLDIEVGELFFVNTFFQASAFNPNHQLLLFYFWVNCSDWKKISVTQNKTPLTQNGERARWVSLDNLSSEVMTFPIDKLVANKLASECS
jgi:8-oxo-dGTP diphosphatase